MRSQGEAHARGPEAPAPELDDRAERWFALGVWVLMLVLAGIYVATYGTRVPFIDDLVMAPFVRQDHPILLRELWTQHNEHRIPLPRLLYVWLARWSGSL